MKYVYMKNIHMKKKIWKKYEKQNMKKQKKINI